jgi:hypothetical protein
MATLAWVLMAAALCAGGVPLPTPLSEREQKLQQAFGTDCDELRWGLKMLFRDKGLVLAAEKLTMETDGRVKLTPCSIAHFTNNSNSKLQIVTTRSEWVLLALDRPIQNLSELASSKILAAEFPGGLKVQFKEANAPPRKRIGDEIFNELVRNRSFDFDNGKTTLYIKDARDHVLFLPAILRRDAHGTIESVTWAREAKFIVDEKGGKILLEMRDLRWVQDQSDAFFENKVLVFPISKAKPPQQRDFGK